MRVLDGVKLINHVAADSHSTGNPAVVASIDMSEYESVALNVVLSDKGASGTLDGKLQHSEDGSTDWTDDDGSTGNVVAITQLTDNGEAQLAIDRPIRRYYRTLLTVGGNAVDAYVSGAGAPRVNKPVTY